MSSSKKTPSETEDNVCVVCFKNVEIYSIGVCEHAVCFECSTRMRVLCRQNECPICRQDLPKVVFTEEIQPYSKLVSIASRTTLQDRKYGILFTTTSLQAAYYSLLDHRCRICDSEETTFRTFPQLKDHMRRAHELSYCDICVENLRIFSSERRAYTRQELGLHRRKGDADDTSHRGHPLCEFCDQRFMDSDELFRHLRRIHLFCHYCDADGKHQYYQSMEDLRDHFRSEHYLCEEGECRALPLIAVFRDEIDLKAHIASKHCQNMSKSAKQQARTLELEFTLAPRPRSDNNYRNRRAPYRRNEDDAAGLGNYQDADTGGGETYGGNKAVNSLTSQDFPALGTAVTSHLSLQSRPTTTVSFTSRVNALSSEDFPTLGKSRPSSAVTITTNSSNRSNRAPEVTITRSMKGHSSGALERNTQNFPALGGPSTSTGTSTVHLRVNSNSSDSSKVSIHVNHKPSTSVTISNPQNAQKASEAFPVLGNPKSVTQPQWVQPKGKKQEPKASKVAPPPQLPPSDLSQFPTLLKNGSKNDKKAKKTSSISVAMNNVAGDQGASLKQDTVHKGGNKSKATSSKAKENSHESEVKNNGSSSKQNQNESTVNTVGSVGSCDNENKSKSKKKKNKIANDSFVTENNNDSSALCNNIQNFKEVNSKNVNNNKNGVVKKISELKIGALNVTEPENNHTAVGKTKPPPGFTVKPPPGFNCNLQSFPSLSSNDLTFTNSTGQSYSITPNKNYFPPNNFTARNENLFKKFRTVISDNDVIQEFKKYSSLFQTGTISADKYYEHCRIVMRGKFDEIFPELLVLLPDIDKQQELFSVISENDKKLLMICANCNQIIFKNELKDHHNYHTLDNHFPSLGKVTQKNSAWKNH